MKFSELIEEAAKKAKKRGRPAIKMSPEDMWDKDAWGDLAWSKDEVKAAQRMEREKAKASKAHARHENNRYDDDEVIYVVVSKMFKDDVLAKMFGRTISAIQQLRSNQLNMKLRDHKKMTATDKKKMIDILFKPERWTARTKKYYTDKSKKVGSVFESEI